MGEEDRAFLRVCVSGRGCCLGMSEGGSYACFQTLRPAGFALVCVPMRLPVWLGYKHPQSTGGGQRVQVQLAGAGLWPRSGAVCGPRVSWCLRLCLTVGCCGRECPETQGCVSTGSCTARVLGGGLGVLPGRSWVSLCAVSGPPRGCPVFRVATHTSSVVHLCRVL